MQQKDKAAWERKGFTCQEHYHTWLHFNGLVHSNIGCDISNNYDDNEQDIPEQQ